MEEYWGTVGNSENFSVGPEPTREALIDLLSHECVPGQKFSTGIRRDINIVSLMPHAEYLIEATIDNLYDEVGETSEYWNPSNEAIQDLNSRLEIILKDWIKTWGLQPLFFAVDKIEEHTAT